jgi:hypothetical protein
MRVSKIGMTCRMIRSLTNSPARRRTVSSTPSCWATAARASDDQEAALHLVEQALVEIVERDRGAVLATTQLGGGGHS